MTMQIRSILQSYHLLLQQDTLIDCDRNVHLLFRWQTHDNKPNLRVSSVPHRDPSLLIVGRIIIINWSTELKLSRECRSMAIHVSNHGFVESAFVNILASKFPGFFFARQERRLGRMGFCEGNNLQRSQVFFAPRCWPFSHCFRQFLLQDLKTSAFPEEILQILFMSKLFAAH